MTVGRLKRQKNQESLIKAFAAFNNEHPGHTLHIFGKGELENELRQLVSELSLERSVFFEGFVTNVHEAIRDAEMFVLSSNYEGMPNALLEAMMMGLPCVTTSYEGVEELLGDSGCCLIVPVGDNLALAGAMARIAEEPQLRSLLSQKATAFSERFTVDRVIPLWEKEL